MVGSTQLAPGHLVGRFEVVRGLKVGGMGAVYLALDSVTGEQVALKVMHPASAASVERFEREGRLATELAHPNIVAGRGHGSTPEGLPWLAMELLHGEDLEARLARGPVSVSEVVAIAMQVCSGLEYAHALGVVHRDLKPSNIFLCEGPSLRVKVLDFGVARLASEQQLTRTGNPVGTPSYMSPEQARADRDIDPRSDLWSLGVVLYECLSGRLPFHAQSVIGTLYQIVSLEPADLARLAPGVPRPLVELVRRALHKSRDDRPSSASALRSALAAVETDQDRPSHEPPGTDAGPPTDAPEPQPSPGPEELRLASVVCLDAVRDPVFVEGVALELQGRIEPLASGATLVLFGVDRWSGDEPVRAARLAHAVASACGAVGVATGRVLRSGGSVAGGAIDAAAALAGRGGVALDGTTLSFCRSEGAPTPEGGATPGAPRGSLSGEPWPSEFVGREGELSALLQCVEGASLELQTKSVVVLGVAGMGKSRLLHEAAQRALARDPTARVLVVRCEVCRRDAPFAALRDALAQSLDPGVAGVFSPSSRGSGDPVAALDRARASLRTVLEGLASEGPLVLAIDDAQWLDMSSRAAVRWVREQALDLPLALWIFGRMEAHDAAQDLAGAVPSLELAPLDRALSARLMRAVAGEAPDALLDRAGGHPLFLEELGRAWKGRGARSEGLALPVSIEGAHLAQLDQLAPAEREFLKRAAVLGRTWWAEAVASMGGDAEALPRLRGASLVVPRPRGRFPGAKEYAFRTGVCHEVTYGLLPEALRARLHALAAEWLSARQGVSPDELARHWDLAGDSPRAALAYVASAEAAAGLADVATACAHAARALALTEDPELRWRALVARDHALQVGGDLELQGAGLDALEALAPSLGLARETEAAWRRCYHLRVNGEAERALDAGALAVALSERLGDAHWGALASIELGLLLADAGRPDEARAHAARGRALASRSGDPWLKARAAATEAYVDAETGELEAVLERFASAAEEFARVGDRRREALMHNNAAAMMLQCGRLSDAAGQFEAALDASRRIGNAVTAAVATHNLGVIRRLQGDPEGARSAQDRAWAEARRLGFARLASFVATERGYLALTTGEGPDRLALRAAEARWSARTARSPALVASARALALRVAAARGEAAPEAVAEARESLRALASPEGRFELALALWEADGRLEADRVEALEARGRLLARVRDPSDRAAALASLARRYLVPGALEALDGG